MWYVSVHLHVQLSLWCLLVLFVRGAIDRRVTGLACRVFAIQYKPLLAMLVFHTFFVISLSFHVMLSVLACVYRSERKEISRSCSVFYVDTVHRLLFSVGQSIAETIDQAR